MLEIIGNFKMLGKIRVKIGIGIWEIKIGLIGKNRGKIQKSHFGPWEILLELRNIKTKIIRRIQKKI